MASQSFATGKVVLITGCTAGIGKAFTHMIAEKAPRRIILVARNESKANSLKEELEEKFDNIEYRVLIGDLSKPRDAFGVAKTVVDEEEQLDIVISNAGIWKTAKTEDGSRRHVQEDGLEIHFATNYLSMVILCKVLKPLLERSESARIVVTGSFTGWSIMKGKVRQDNLQGEKKHTRTTVNDIVYAQSKLLQSMWAKKFATTLADNVVINVFDPGMVATNIEKIEVYKKLGFLFTIAKKLIGAREPNEGAAPGLWLASDVSEAGTINGHYIDWKVSGTPKYHKPVELGYYPNYKMKASQSTLNEEELDFVWDYTEKIFTELEEKYC